MRHEMLDREGNRLGVLHLDVNPLLVAQALHRIACVLGPALPDEPNRDAAPVAVLKGSTAKRTRSSKKRGARK